MTEVASAVATVITLIDFSLKTTENLRKKASSVKNGARNIRRLKETLLDVDIIYRKTQLHLVAHHETFASSNRKHGNYLLVYATQKLEICRDHLQQIYLKLTRNDTASGSNAFKSLGKRLRWSLHDESDVSKAIEELCNIQNQLHYIFALIGRDYDLSNHQELKKITDLLDRIVNQDGDKKATLLAAAYDGANRPDRPSPQTNEPNLHYSFKNGDVEACSSITTDHTSEFTRALRGQMQSLMPQVTQEISAVIDRKYRAWFSPRFAHIEAILAKIEREMAGWPEHSVECNQGQADDINASQKEIFTGSSGQDSPGIEEHRQFVPERSEAEVVISRPRRRITYHKSWSFELGIGILMIYIQRYCTCTETVSPQTFKARVIFRPVQKLLDKGLSLSYSHVYDARGNITITPRITSFAIVPTDSPVMRAAADGDILKLRDLFKLGQASPKDQNPEGFTPLYFAAKSGHSAICDYLVTEGVGTIETEMPNSAFYGAHSYMMRVLDGDYEHGYKDGLPRYMAICRALERAGCYIEETPAYMIPLIRLAERPDYVPGGRFLTHDEIELSRKFFAFLKDIGLTVNSSSIVVEDYSATWLDMACMTCDSAYIQMIIVNGANVDYRTTPNISSPFGYVASPGPLFERPDDEIYRCFVLLIDAGCDVHWRNDTGSTPLEFIQAVGKMRIWLLALRDCGVDLKQYLEIELGRFGESSSVEHITETLGELTARRGRTYEDD